MAHPTIQQQTLRACHSNAESTGACLMKHYYEQAVRSNNLLNLNDPAYWSVNPIAREGVLAQCRRRGPSDEMAYPYPYCGVASASKLNDLRGW